MDRALIAIWLGHESVETTQIYLDANLALKEEIPEAPANWRRGITFNTPVSDDTEYARMLILAALNRIKLLHY